MSFVVVVVLKQIKVTMNDEDMDTYVFAVGTRKALVRLQKEMQDLVCQALLTQIILRNCASLLHKHSASEPRIIMSLGHC